MSTPPTAKLPLREIKRIEFGVLSPDEVRQYSIGEITCSESSGAGREPLQDSLSDLRMGATDKFRCATCNQGIQDCPGHFGHIELARPVYHVYYIQTIKKVLECICLRCAHIRVTPNDKWYKKLKNTASLRQRFKLMWKHCKGKRACENDNCGVLHPQVRLQRHEIVVGRARRGGGGGGGGGEGDNLARKVLSTQEVLEILRRIPDPECWLLGFNPIKARPEWMILTVLPVPPPCVRPSVSMGNGSSGIDDLTHMLTSILRHSNAIKNTENDPTSHSLEDHENLLIQFVSTYFDNETNLFSKASVNVGRSIKALKSRLSGKQGRIRGHLMGKRVNFTARTVITGDPNLSIDEIGVPYEIAMNLTFPERVTQFNIERLQATVNNGPKVYPGAAYWERTMPNGVVKRRDLLYNKTPVDLQVGDVVKRHLINGDLVLFNRQPTLHRPSMMCHSVRVMRGKTFRMNLSVTTPYNADFDGDEMNLHIAQSYEAQGEALILSRVSHLIMSPQGNKPVMGIVQDALCAVRKFTLRDALFTRDQVFNMLMRLPKWDGIVPAPCIMKPRALWSGKQIFSLILPSYLHYVGRHAYPSTADGGPMCPFDTSVLIEHGELLSGIVCKKAVGSSAGGLIDIIWREGGADGAKDFFDGCQYLVNEFMINHGFTVGLGDCIISKDTEAYIENNVREACKVVDDLLAGTGDLSKLSKAEARTLETTITRTLAKARDTSGSYAAESLPWDNNFKQMVQAGSKGSMINISQISAVVGQQNVDGGRITFTMRDRALPYFERGDIRPAAKGFVEKSYLNGLRPTEFFFHAMGGREGLIDTACRTSETGYLQRKLVKALEDYTVTYDTTVRASNGSILQFAYGEDGIDGVYIERQRVLLTVMNDKQVNGLSGIKDEVAQLFLDRAYLRTYLPKLEDSFHAPLNFARTIKRAVDTRGSRGKTPCDTRFVYKTVTAFIEDIKPWSFELFNVLVRFFFASKSVVHVHKMYREDLLWCLQEIKGKFARAKVESGEAVGIIAAQSIGEPTTQLTLNSFHASGDVNQLVSSGVGRIKELVNDLKQFKSPSMTIPLLPSHQSQRSAEKFAKEITPVFLQDIIKGYSIQEKILDEDLTWYNIWKSLGVIPAVATSEGESEEGQEQGTVHLNQWSLRIVVDRDALFDVDMTMEMLSDAIVDAFEHDLVCVYSDDNADDLVLYLHFEDEEAKEKDIEAGKVIVDGQDFLKDLSMNMMEHLCLRGIPEVEIAQARSKSMQRVDELTGGIVDDTEWFVETIGINLPAVIVMDGVDRARLYCNDPKVMHQYYGIESARVCLLREIRQVIEGSYVNYRHLALLCDTMTSKGQVVSIGRHGLNRINGGPLRRSSFEESTDTLMMAALNCEKDHLTGVSENIMVGKHIPSGTGVCSIHWKGYVDGAHDVPQFMQQQAVLST